MTKLLGKHYRNQALFELHTLIFGLDVLGNPVSIVRGVVFGAKDLFYEPFKVQSEYLLSIYRLNCFVCLFVCLSVCLSVCLPVYLSVCLFGCDRGVYWDQRSFLRVLVWGYAASLELEWLVRL